MSHFVDLHAHFLPALDDGSKSAEMSRQMVGAVVALGYDHIHATPHQRSGMFLPTREAIDEAFAHTQRDALAAFPGLTFGLAAENFWDEVFHERITHGGLPCYPGEKAFLFEVSPAFLPPQIEQTLFQIRLGGRLPVMAHPERYHALQTDLDRAAALSRTAAMLVDLAALDGAHGRAEMKAARRLVEEGIAHAAATDIHTPDDQRAVAAGMAWIKKQLGPDALTRLLDENPRRILAGDLPS